MSDSHLLSKNNILPKDYQKPLVSGTDIKTVNSNSLLGSGNISLQEPIIGAASSVLSSNLTESRAVISNANGKLDVSSTTATELGYVHGVTSNIQAQLNGKANVDLSNLSATGEAHFQAKLVSGTNIKTINGNSILGSGDLTVSGGANTSLSNLSATGEAHFANPSLSNINSTGKAAAVGWGMSNYAAGVARSVDTTYTPSKNVLVIFYSFCNNGDANRANIYVNGTMIEQAGNGYASGWDTLIAYIPKGTPYKCGRAGYANYHSIIEYPLIGG